MSKILVVANEIKPQDRIKIGLMRFEVARVQRNEMDGFVLTFRVPGAPRKGTVLTLIVPESYVFQVSRRKALPKFGGV